MIGYFDMPCGLSGDMCLGCLVDAGWPIESLRELLVRLKLTQEQCTVSAQDVMKGAIRATLVRVDAATEHHHRRLHHIRDMIDAADLPQSVRDRATAVFTRLAQAEAKVHDTTVDKVHFHEVGAIDSIVDIVGSVCGLHELGVDTLYASAVPLGEGWVDTDHGRIPLPAPATLELLAGAGAPTRPAPGVGEWITPTGAALLAELATFEQPVMNITRIATGAGRRDADVPNIVRLWLGDPVVAGPIVQIETNIDDMNPQHYSAVSDRLFAAGARDVWLTPVQMKKGRPAVVLSVLAAARHEHAIVDIMLRETTTLGVRVTTVRRHEAQRELCNVDTPYGLVRVKLKRIDGETVGAAPEYDDCVALSAHNGTTVRQVYDAALVAAHAMLTK